MNPLYVAGLGPGGRELLTLKAARLLKTADIVIKASRLAGASANIERWVTAGRRVVVVCEGDPLSHAGNNRLPALLKHLKVPVEFVPGVHPALAACAEWGLVPTHRDRASTLAVGYSTRRKPEADTLLRYSKKKGFSISVGKRQESRFPNQPYRRKATKS